MGVDSQSTRRSKRSVKRNAGATSALDKIRFVNQTLFTLCKCTCFFTDRLINWCHVCFSVRKFRQTGERSKFEVKILLLKPNLPSSALLLYVSSIFLNPGIGLRSYGIKLELVFHRQFRNRLLFGKYYSGDRLRRKGKKSLLDPLQEVHSRSASNSPYYFYEFISILVVRI